MDWHYGRKKNGMYLDGHEWEDVVEYQKAFLECWEQYTKRMAIFDNHGNITCMLAGFPIAGGQFHLILITHDESTFYANDCRKTSGCIPVIKQHRNAKEMELHYVIISDFLTSELGWLRDGTEYVPMLLQCLGAS